MRHEVLHALLSIALLVMGGGAAMAQCPSLPYAITNGQVADATQVMANLNQILTCLNTGQLTAPPAPTVQITGAGGGTVSIQNPSASSNYNFNLPAGPGSVGQILLSGGPSGPMTWSSIPSLTSPPLVDGIPLVRPAASTFIWMNQGTASLVEHANGPITLTVPGGSGEQVRGLEQAPPASAPYTLTAKISQIPWTINYEGGGIYVRDNNGKILTLHVQGSNGNPSVVQVNEFNSASSYNTSPAILSIGTTSVWWLRIYNDGAKWNFLVSPNGADWVTIYSQPLTAWLGSSIAGLGVEGDSNYSSSHPPILLSLWSFELTTGTGTNSSWSSTSH